MKNEISRKILQQFVDEKRRELKDLHDMMKEAEELQNEEIILYLHDRIQDLQEKYKKIRVHQLIESRKEKDV